MRLIDADALEDIIYKFYCKRCRETGCDRCKGCKVTNILGFMKKLCGTVEAKPVVHAHWISASWEEDEEDGIENTYSDEFICSSCKEHLYFPDAIEKEDIGFSFCPYCGAQMDEKEGE